MSRQISFSLGYKYPPVAENYFLWKFLQYGLLLHQSKFYKEIYIEVLHSRLGL